MTRKPSVTVQMTDDESELDKLLAAANAPRNPGGPDDPIPTPPDEEDPTEEEVYEDEEEPEDDDNGEAEREDDPANPAAVNPPPEGVRPTAGADARAGGAELAGSVPEIFGELIPPTKPNPHAVRYEARITIVDAYQYSGALKDAPDWVDRNWAAYADNFDPLRQLEPGPALRVPTYRGDTVLCRVGDYVARQEVKITADQPGEIKIEVWEKEQFQRIFMPVEKTPVRPYGASEINKAPTGDKPANKGRGRPAKSKSSPSRKPAKAAA